MMSVTWVYVYNILVKWPHIAASKIEVRYKYVNHFEVVRSQMTQLSSSR